MLKLLKVATGDKEKFKVAGVAEASKYKWQTIIDEHWLPFLEHCEEELRPLIKDGKTTKWDQEVS